MVYDWLLTSNFNVLIQITQEQSQKTFNWLENYQLKEKPRFEYENIHDTSSKNGNGGFFIQSDNLTVYAAPVELELELKRSEGRLRRVMKDYAINGRLTCISGVDKKCKAISDDSCRCGDNNDGDLEKCGLDCKSKVTKLSHPVSYDEAVQGNQWVYYSLPSDQAFTVQVRASREVSVYLRKGVDNLPD